MEIFGTPRDSCVARLDPRLRLGVTLVFAVTVCFSGSPPALLAALAVATGLIVLARRPARDLLRRLALLNLFFLLLASSIAVALPGQTLGRIGPLHVTDTGLHRAGVILLRANAVVLYVAALLGTMEAPHLGFALDRLRVPSTLTHVLLFMVRYIEVIHQEYHRIRNAMRLRAFRPGCNRHTLRSLGYLIGLLLVRSLERSDRILAAMKCRGFHGRYYVLHTCRLTIVDAVSAGLFACVLGALIALEVLWKTP